MKPTIDRLQQVRIELHNALEELDGDRSDVADAVRTAIRAAMKVNEQWIEDWAKRATAYLRRT
jgi:hypothetical protein